MPGISERMLILQLREMENSGLVHREAYHQVPPKAEYSLTEFGTGPTTNPRPDNSLANGPVRAAG